MSEGLVIVILSTKGQLMEDDYGWDDISENFFEEDELSPEEQVEADKAFYRQQELEAYAEFLDAPFCFD